MTPRESVVAIAERYIGQGPECCAEAAPGYDLSKESWCQIFWLHCLREAGLTDRVWPSGPAWPKAWLPLTAHPEPGDMLYVHEPYQHGAVFTGWDAEGYALSIDGNSSGRVVRRQRRPRSAISGFYSIGKLCPKAEPAPAGWVHGVDVSHHQRPASVDWAGLAAGGVRAAVVRACYGAKPDAAATEHVRRARAAGLAIGLYMFWRSTEQVGAQLDVLADQHWACEIGHGDLAPWLDVETDPGVRGGELHRGWRPTVDSLMTALVQRYGAAVLYGYESGLAELGWPAWPTVVAHYRQPGEQRWPPVAIRPPAGATVVGQQYGVGPGLEPRGLQAPGAPGALDRDWLRWPMPTIGTPRADAVGVVDLDDHQIAALAALAAQEGLRRA